MDTGTGEMAQVIPEVAQKLAKADIPVFRKGEILKIKESRFKIMSLGKREMRLRLLPHRVEFMDVDRQED